MGKAKRTLIFALILAFLVVPALTALGCPADEGRGGLLQGLPSYEIEHLGITIAVREDNRATITLDYVIELERPVELFQIILPYTCTSAEAMDDYGPLSTSLSVESGASWISVQLRGTEGTYSFTIKAESPNLVLSYGTRCSVSSFSILVKHLEYKGRVGSVDFSIILPFGTVADLTSPEAEVSTLEDGRLMYSWSFTDLFENRSVPAIFYAELSYSNNKAVIRAIAIGIGTLTLTTIPIILYSRATGMSWKFPTAIALILGIYRLLITQLLFPALISAFNVSPYLGIWLFHVLDPLLILVGCAASPMAGFLTGISMLFTQHIPQAYYVPGSLPLELGEHLVIPVVASFLYGYLPGLVYRKKGLRTFMVATYLSLLLDSAIEFAWAYVKISSYSYLYLLHYDVDVSLLKMVLGWELVSGTLYAATASVLFISQYHFSPSEIRRPSISGLKSLIKLSFIPKNLLVVVPILVVLLGAGLIFRQRLATFITVAASIVPYLDMGLRAMQKFRDYLKVAKEIKVQIEELRTAKVGRRKELLKKLEEAYRQGRISREVYEELKKKYGS